MVDDTSGSLTAFPCNTCSLSFESSVLQRSHMRSAWHIHNLQRKISGLPAQSEAEFEECVDQNTNNERKKSRHNDNSVNAIQRDTELEASSESDGYSSETLDSNIRDKEQSGHASRQTETSLSSIKVSTSFFLPPFSTSPAAIEPLLSYLSLLIYTYHECIYCAREKNSIQGVQSHMRDKAHCKLDVSLYEDFFSSGEDMDTQDEEDDTTGAEIDERAEDKDGTQEKTRHSSIANTDGAKKLSHRKTRKEKIQRVKPHLPHARSRTSLSQQQPASANTASLQTTTAQHSPLTLSSSSSHVPPLPLPPTPTNGRNSALSLAGLSTAQLVSLAGLDKKMRRQQVSAQNRVGHMALRQPVKTIYYKTENPVYQAG